MLMLSFPPYCRIKSICDDLLPTLVKDVLDRQGTRYEYGNAKFANSISDEILVSESIS